MTHESVELPVRAEYDLDWHVFLDQPEQGALGYCTGADEEFAPVAAARVLAEGGWRVVGPWTEQPTGDAPYAATATATTTTAAPATDDEIRDRHITDLRTALERAVQELVFCAGWEAAADPGQSARLMGAAGEIEAVLARTALADDRN
ncbi:hypothetical protein ABZ622_41775 [Streptomyces sp. NPDC007164]|uniref:hypothetical protein n=1 Tax=Streptomyces sp. NPDC007164 TaxID=3156918 RepID=UPI0033C209DE